MADGSRFLKCDQCGAVLDRRAAGDYKDGGAFRYGSEHELKAYASSLGWTEPKPNYHLCPAHPDQQEAPEKS